MPPSQGGRYSGFGNTIDQPNSNSSNEFFDQFATGLSSLTLNAGRFASAAKDNIVKISSTAASQATELTRNVNEKVKEGTLIDSLSYGATNVGSKLGNVWSSLNSYWTGTEQFPSIKNSESNSSFGRNGYNSVPGDTNTSMNSNGNNNLLFRFDYYDIKLYNKFFKSSFNSYSDESNSPETLKQRSSPPKSNNNNNNNKSNRNSQNNNNNNNNDNWGDWDDSWEQTENSYQSGNKTSKPAKSKKDLMNFDDDNWETVETPYSKKD